MHIDKTNYEAYLIDYLEENLDAAEMEAVRAFLLKNPDIAEELEMVPMVSPEDETLPKAAIWNLTRNFEDVDTITSENFEEFCIAWHEGDLDEYNKKRVKVYLRLHPEMKSLFNIYAAMPFIPDETIEYKYKKSLKKQRVVPLRHRFIWAVSSAAALLAGILIYNTNQPEMQQPITPVVATNSEHNTINISHEPEKITPNRALKPVKTLNTNVASKVEKPINNTQEKILLATIAPITPKVKTKAEIQFETPTIKQTNTVNKPPQVVPVEKPVTRIARISQLAKRSMSKEQLLWEAIYAGVRGYNKLTENELALNTATNYEGKVTAIDVIAGNIEISRKIKKNITN